MAKNGSGVSRVAVTLDEESRKQLEVLSGVFRISVSSVVSMAVARWFHAEPLVSREAKEESKHDGNDHSGV